MPFVSIATSDHQVLYECIAILNSFLIHFSEAIEVFHVYASKLEEQLPAILELPT